jgi:catechol 2,3-dioxygenase-like lactoylglutathione lyase family enzyme
MPPSLADRRAFGGEAAAWHDAGVFGDIHHLGLTVRDVEASAAWYVDVLGFRRTGEFTAPDGARRTVFLRHDGLRARLGLVEHAGGDRAAFDETRVGLDHLAFAVAGRHALDAWAERLAAAGVAHSPVAPANTVPGAAVLVFRDPDGIQLELFADPAPGVATERG